MAIIIKTSKKPYFHSVAFAFNALGIFSIVYIYGGFYDISKHGAQFKALPFIGIITALVCAAIGYSRKEHLNVLTFISSGFSMIIGTAILMLYVFW
jgi:hypothetical protein